MPNRYPRPMNWNKKLLFILAPVMGFPLVNTYVAPRKMVMVAKVAINGAAFP
ncbi:Uncharacterised protein [Mycobacteroides abscessus subsp. abscessus]|nr:Uncharacterised protein [Mycobacteroides abscessus subsp. abscessus]